MRKNPTLHEKKFADRMELEGIFFKSQKVIGNFIVDFLVGRTIVEIDGYSHFEAEQAVYDEERTKYLESKGYVVIRVRNENVVSFDMSRLKEKPKRPKSDRCPKSERQPTSTKRNEILEASGIEYMERIEAIKKKNANRTVSITPPTIPPPRPQIRFTYATLKK